MKDMKFSAQSFEIDSSFLSLFTENIFFAQTCPDLSVCIKNDVCYEKRLCCKRSILIKR